MRITPRIQQAIDFGRKAHAGQVRKYSGIPYHTHPEAVAELVASVTSDEDTIIAAIGHDWGEDTNVSFLEIERLLGTEVAILIWELTDQYTHENYPQWNRESRKTKEAERLATISHSAQIVKIADLIHNTADILKNDKEFAIVYIKEKARVLSGLTNGNAELYVIAKAQVDAAKKELDIT